MSLRDTLGNHWHSAALGPGIEEIKDSHIGTAWCHNMGLAATCSVTPGLLPLRQGMNMKDTR